MSDHEYVTDQDRFEAVVEELTQEPRYGFDTEFHRERTYWPRLALIQIAWDGNVVLVDPFEVDVRPLRRVLEGEATAIVHAADQDLEILQRECGAVPARLFDTQVVAGFAGFRSPGLAVLLRRLLDVELQKDDQLTIWTERPLTREQCAYAASDVAYLLELHDVLVARLEANGRLDWAMQECEIVRTSQRHDRDPDTLWWKLSGSRRLNGRARCVAQVLTAWREEYAAEVDRPVGHVLPDISLVAMSQRPPKKPADFKSVRGLDRRGIRRELIPLVLEQIERGRRLQPEQLRIPPRTEPDKTLRPALALGTAWVAQLSEELGIEARSLGTRDDITRLLAGDETSRLGSGWRRSLVGEPLLRIAAGDLALACDGNGGLALEERAQR